jgi:dTDP-4-dehydrorhamnose 3,5-epimerase
MKFIKTNIPEVILIEPTIIGDPRGYFLESFNLEKFEESVRPIKFVQDNESKSFKGVLRGLHFQKPPFAQAKLIRCVEGEILDVAVDIRKGSPTYGEHVVLELSGDNKKQLFVPRGFAHGFIVLSKTALIAYKVDNFYSSEHDEGILWNDSKLGIDWKIEKGAVFLSEKDRNLSPLELLDNPFNYNSDE